MYFLPLTSRNVGKYVVELEDRYIPSVSTRQKEVAAQLRVGLADGREKAKQLRTRFANQVEVLSSSVRERTGLKFGEKEKEDAKK